MFRSKRPKRANKQLDENPNIKWSMEIITDKSKHKEKTRSQANSFSPACSHDQREESRLKTRAPQFSAINPCEIYERFQAGLLIQWSAKTTKMTSKLIVTFRGKPEIQNHERKSEHRDIEISCLPIFHHALFSLASTHWQFFKPVCNSQRIDKHRPTDIFASK